MRDICDQLSLHALTLHLMLNGIGHALTDLVQMLTMLSQRTLEIGCIYGCIQIALCQFLTALKQYLRTAQQTDHKSNNESHFQTPTKQYAAGSHHCSKEQHCNSCNHSETDDCADLSRQEWKLRDIKTESLCRVLSRSHKP